MGRGRGTRTERSPGNGNWSFWEEEGGHGTGGGPVLPESGCAGKGWTECFSNTGSASQEWGQPVPPSCFRQGNNGRQTQTEAL